MNKSEYMNYISAKLAGYFDIEKNKEYEGIEYDLIAKSFIRSEKYLGSKKITIYAMENTEYLLLKHFKELNRELIDKHLTALSTAANSLVKLKEDHMCTVITGLLVLDKEIDEESKNKIEKFKYEKSFMFGLKGWAYVRLIVVQLRGGEVLVNKRGLEVKKFYEAKKK